MSARSLSVRHCRLCRSRRLKTYLHLGKTPLANSYLKAAQLKKSEFKEELALQLCLDCGLSQLTKVVHPDRMFKNYLYVSSTPKTFRDHCADLAVEAIPKAALPKKALVMDIGSNDGCLLSYFKKQGMTVVGVDPAVNLAKEANARGITTLCRYWGLEAAEEVLRRYGSPRVITSTNVLAHTHDIHAFAQAVASCLHPDGVWMIEVPYLLDFIRHNEFDTVYHEHLSYFSLHALSRLAKDHGLEAFDMDYFPALHGGTLRVWVAQTGRRAIHAKVTRTLAQERRFGVERWNVYRAFARRVQANKKSVIRLLGRLKKQGKTLWAYGASAKGNTLMNYYGVDHRTIPVVVDDNPKKWNYYAPGSHMRILGTRELANHSVDYLLLLAWNFKKEIMRRSKKEGYEKAFISPIPKAQIIRGAP